MGERLSMLILVVWASIAILAPYIASEGSLIPFGYDDVLGAGSNVLAPLSQTDGKTHWLGTDTIGRDVAAGMVHGARVSFIICCITLFVSLMIGVSFGMLIGYFGDKKLRANLLQVLFFMAAIFFLYYYLSDLIVYGWSAFSMLMTGIIFIVLIFGIRLLSNVGLRTYSMPLDAIGQRIFEVKESLPNLFLILAISAVVIKPNIWTLSLTIVAVQWVTFARYARSEMQQVASTDYFLSARAQGVGLWKLLFRHALPNLMSPILIVIAFSLSGVILLESSLSFLGIGLPVSEVTWGKLLAEARKNSNAWWLAVFPGLAIFALLYAFNTLANMYSRLLK